MAWTKSQIIALVSVAYLLIPLVIGSYALHTIRTQSLPIPKVLGAFTLALPVVAGAALQPIISVSGLERRKKTISNALSRWFPLTVLILLVYESVVAALSGTYIGPSNGLRCGLDERWRSLYHLKDTDAVRRIQDAFQCCGLHSVLDMAWPFPGHGFTPNTCQTNYSRTRSCFESWRGKERKVAGLMLTVALLVFIWKAVITWFWLGRFRSEAYHRFSQDGEDEGENVQRRALDYHGANNRYLDEPNPEERSSGESNAIDSDTTEAERSGERTESLI